MMKSLSILSVLLLSSSISLAGSDHHHHHHKKQKRHHKAHVHGSGKLMIAASGDTLNVELELPAHDIIGFEHKPKNDKQKELLTKAVARLKQISENIEISKNANCLPKEKAKVDSPLIGKNHDHHHDHHKKNDEHSEFKVSYHFKCKNMKNLTWVKILSFKHFKNMENLKAMAVMDSGQFSGSLNAKKVVFKLEK